jgi:hypothetical protein
LDVAVVVELMRQLGLIEELGRLLPKEESNVGLRPRWYTEKYGPRAPESDEQIDGPRAGEAAHDAGMPESDESPYETESLEADEQAYDPGVS